MDEPSTFESLRQALRVALHNNMNLRRELTTTTARISRQRRALRQLNRAHGRLRDSNSVLRHMLEVSEQTRKIGVSAGHSVPSDINITLPKDIPEWQKVAFEQMMAAHPPQTHTMGAGRDYGKPQNHNHVKPCSCGIFDREAWNLANPGLRGMTANQFIMDETMAYALDAPWYRRAWDWLVFHTTRAFSPDEVEKS